jgi:ATP-dependent RNA helicase DeaD
MPYPKNHVYRRYYSIIDAEEHFYGLIFCNTKAETDDVTRWLIERNYNADALHGDIAQQQREKIMKRFKSRQIKILVATDVAARGIDISDLTHVINLGLPQDPESYVHRIGRTGRAGKEGKAISIVDQNGLGKIRFIEKIANCKIKRAFLPPAEELAELKKIKIQHELDSPLDHELDEPYMKMSYKLLLQNEPEQLVAALLKKAYRHELDIKQFEPINEIKTDIAADKRACYNKKGKKEIKNARYKPRDDEWDTVRLFFALGKESSMTPQKMLQFFNTEFPGQFIKIDNIRVLENFSFLSVSRKDADLILKHFNKKSKGGKPLISLAKS